MRVGSYRRSMSAISRPHPRVWLKHRRARAEADDWIGHGFADALPVACRRADHKSASGDRAPVRCTACSASCPVRSCPAPLPLRTAALRPYVRAARSRSKVRRLDYASGISRRDGGRQRTADESRVVACSKAVGRRRARPADRARPSWRCADVRPGRTRRGSSVSRLLLPDALRPREDLMSAADIFGLVVLPDRLRVSGLRAVPWRAASRCLGRESPRSFSIRSR